MMTEKEKCSLGMLYDANYDTGWSQGEVWRQCIRGDLTVLCIPKPFYGYFFSFHGGFNFSFCS